MNNLITLFREWLEERKYPEDVKKLIQLKRDRIRHHKKKLKRINKCLNGKHPLGSTRHAAKTHKYMINKLNKEIVGIKNHYESNKLKNMTKKYLVPKSTFNCDLGVKTLWQQLEYKVLVESPEGFGVNIVVFFTNEFIKEHFDIKEK